MYKTTSGQTTVTFASFGLYELEDGDNWSHENVEMGPTLTTRVSSGEEAQGDASTMPSSSQETPLPAQNLPEEPKPFSDPPTAQPLPHASRLAKKILSRPPSLNGPPGPPIPMKFVTLEPVAGDTDPENTSSDASSDSDVSTGSTNPTSIGDEEHASELGEPVLRPLTVPPWHRRERRPNVCATIVASEYRPPHTLLDGPMRFPF